MYKAGHPTIKPLGDGFALKSVSSEADVERLDAFNAAIFGDDIAGTTVQLLMHHPHTHPDDWFYVEDAASGQIVSALCLIPWTWRYEEVELKAGEVGIVGTLPAYRGRGLVRQLTAHHHERLHAGGYDVSHIQGIPYFYRQFGYEYAIPLEGGWKVMPYAIAAAPTGPYQFRLAGVADIPALARLYEAATARLAVHAVRDEAQWRYLLEHGVHTDMSRQYWLALDASGGAVSYWAVDERGFGEGLIVSEAAPMPADLGLAVLDRLKEQAAERDKPFIRLRLPASSDLVQAARGCGASDGGTYFWQIHLPEPARLLNRLAPVFERRLAGSIYRTFSEDLLISLYRGALCLHFEEGKLLGVEALGPVESSPVSIPPLLLPVLVFGTRSLAELQAAHPDLSCAPRLRPLLETLFPTVDAYLHNAY